MKAQGIISSSNSDAPNAPNVGARGLTLLELLVVIAIIIAISALVFPFLHGRLAERSFVAMAEQVRAQLLLGRSEAMADRELVQVRFLPQENVIEIVAFVPGRDAIDHRNSSRTSGFGPVDVEAFDDRESDELIEAWKRLRLPRGTNVVRSLPEEIDRHREEGAPLVLDAKELAAIDPVESESDPVGIAVYLTDGTAFLNEPVWLIDSDGRRMRLTVNPWTGVPNLERVAGASEDEIARDDDYELEDERQTDRAASESTSDDARSRDSTPQDESGNSTDADSDSTGDDPDDARRGRSGGGT